MANLRFQVRGKGIASISVRFYRGQEFCCQAVSGLIVPVYLWNNKSQRARSSDEFDIISLQSNLNRLKAFILNQFNIDYSKGIIIDSSWLKLTITNFHNKGRNTTNKKHDVFFCDFVQNYIGNCKNRGNPTTGKPLATATIIKYNNVLTRLKEYEKAKKLQIKHLDIDIAFYKDLVSFLSLHCNYSNSTIKKHLAIIRGFCKEAQLQDITINPASLQKLPIGGSQFGIAPYLNEQEIQAIFDLDLKDEKLKLIRDWFVIQLWTGLRMSDLRKLTSQNIQQDTIEIISTQKTNAIAKIPIHPMVRSVLDSNNGLPPKLPSSVTYNMKIKQICKLAGITQTLMGAKINPNTNRKEKGFYPKYELITSHSCRRSFISNLYQKVSDETLKSLTTHRSNNQLLKYVKITQDEHIEKVRQLWMAS